MNHEDSIIEYYRKQVVEKINNLTYAVEAYDANGNVVKNSKGKPVKKKKLIVPVWTDKMKEFVNFQSGNQTIRAIDVASQIFNLGEHLRDIFYCTKDLTVKTDREQGTLSRGGTVWESLVTYYLNMCLVNTRTVVFMQATPFKAIKDAVTFNSMDSSSEADIIAITFPDNMDFTDDYNKVITRLRNNNPKGVVKGTALDFLYSNRIKKKETMLARLSNYLVDYHYNELGVHVLQCKTNWNDSIQAPMLWSLVYYLSRNNVVPQTASSIKFGSGLHTLSRLEDFSYSFVTVPTQNNGDYDTDKKEAIKHRNDFYKSKFASTSLPVKRAALIKGGCYWGLPKHDNIYPISELLNTNLKKGIDKNHIIDVIEENLQKNIYRTHFNYFNLLK